jgi:flagellar biosynthesis anti-sigma factor FlgM
MPGVDRQCVDESAFLAQQRRRWRIMNITENNSHPMSSPLPEAEVSPPHTWEEKHSFEPIEALDLPESLSRLSIELVRSLVDASETREAKIRELQEAIKNGTYRVSDEQIADKMLRNMLLDDLP